MPSADKMYFEEKKPTNPDKTNWIFYLFSKVHQTSLWKQTFKMSTSRVKSPVLRSHFDGELFVVLSNQEGLKWTQDLMELKLMLMHWQLRFAEFKFHDSHQSMINRQAAEAS